MSKLKEAAKFLAEAHRKADPKTREVWLAPDKKEQEIRLVEVSDSVRYTGEILPVHFQPKGDIIFPSVVVLMSRGELDDLRSGRLKPPSGWSRPNTWERL